jgi:ATP-dependent helicase IRC3
VPVTWAVETSEYFLANFLSRNSFNFTFCVNPLIIIINHTNQGIMIKLRDYQEEAIETICKTFEDHDRQFICMPTGSGKTITFLSYANQFQNRILVIVPSCQLLEQVYETALKFYDSSVISRKGNGFDEEINDIGECLHICTIQSARGKTLNDLDWADFDLMVIDEAHHSQAGSYINLIKALDKGPDTLILGVTATPDRADGQLLKEILGINSFSLDVMNMIQNKQLSEIEGFSVKTKIDLSDVETRNGEFSLNQLFKKLCIKSRNKMIIDVYKKEMKDRKTIIFCINIEHSKIINQLLKDQGLSSCHIDGTMSKEQKSSILSGFRNGEFSILCNCQILTEGFDEPSINGIILARPTRSRSLFIQMIGRGLRLFPEKENCKIIDIVDTHRSLLGFANLATDSKIPELESFKSSNDIIKHVSDELIKITEFTITRADFFGERFIDNREPSEETYEYLKQNKIIYFEPISFDEANFLVWFNELKKEYAHG